MAVDPRDTVPIPHPPGLPFVGNVLDLRVDVPILKIAQLGKQYGEIFSLQLLSKKVLFVSSQRLLNELCDEKRFKKSVNATLSQLRDGTHDGLFTAHNEEENWQSAHRVLVPAFGPLNIHDMFDSMKDIASQLVLKWARYGDAYEISVPEDFTRLTLDTLALCALGHRFNSFYTEDTHPFVSAMMNFLSYAAVRAKRPAYLQPLFRADEAKWYQDIAYMRSLSSELVQNRVDNPTDAKDLLNAMVNGKDPKTGKNLEHESVIDNMITFLIAGHETTSGMLSFVFYYLLKSPDAYRKAQQEVDQVVGDGTITYEHLSKLPYITAVLREASRLNATAPAFTTTPKNPSGEILGGDYFIEGGQDVVAILSNIHRDPAVYGDDAEEFRPERMLDENFNKLPPNSWKPFGNGARGCIGRPFAWQEMLLVVAMLLQYFNFTPADPKYQLEIVSTLTIKPKHFFMRATLREGWTARKVEQSLAGSIHGGKVEKEKASAAPEQETLLAQEKKPVTVLYGSNSGTCEAFAQTLAADAASHGFIASKVDTLDSAKQSLPTDEPVVIITASYEGEPTDNAAHFYNWLSNIPHDEKLQTKFAVFGCGHSDWKQTFHHIPKSIETMLVEHHGERICPIGLANAASGDMMSDFQTWEDQVLWPALTKLYGAKEEDSVQTAVSLGQNLSIEVFSKRASQLRSDVSEAKVLSNKALSAPGVPVKKQIEIQLPSEMTYRAGDYCAILPLNPAEVVHRVMTRFSLPWDAMLNISSRTGTALPTDHPVSAHNLFSAYLELSQPATKRNIAMLIEASEDRETKKQLNALAEDKSFNTEITDKRISLLDLLERFPDIQLPLSAFVGSLISMRVRQYSISSSPLSNPSNLTLTYAILDAPSLSGQGRHVGVASTYLSSLQAGDIVHVAVRQSHATFHLPTDAEHTPIILIAAGTGLAPFRGFIQERAAQIGSGRRLAPAHLYFGCRDVEKDDLYRQELDFWQVMGAVTVHRAYSRTPQWSDNHRHVDTLLLQDSEQIKQLWEQGARVYVCGSRELGESVRTACLKIAKEAATAKGVDDSDEHVAEWFEGMRNVRYSTDVFA